MSLRASSIKSAFSWETREIFEIVKTGIANGSIQGWHLFPNSRRFEKYGTQRGWERIPPQTQAPAALPQPVDGGEWVKIGQLEFLVVNDEPDNPF